MVKNGKNFDKNKYLMYNYRVVFIIKGYFMLLQDKVEMTCSGRTKQYFENLGYELPYAKDNRGRIGIKKGTKILVDLKDVPKYSNVKIKYKCDLCGEVFETPYHSIFTRENSEYLKTGKTYCVKCAAKMMSGEKNPQYKHGCNRYCEYKNNAKRRGIEFNLTPDEFKFLISQPCHYCGGNSKNKFAKSKGNGVDRKNSSIGYIIDNCVPCCSTCNFIKNKMPYNDFILYIRQLYERTKDYEIQK